MNSTNTPSSQLAHLAGRSAGPRPTVSVLSAFPSHGQRNSMAYLPFYDLYDPSVSSSLGHGVPAAVNLSLPHTISILHTWTKVYGYSVHKTQLQTPHKGAALGCLLLIFENQDRCAVALPFQISKRTWRATNKIVK